MKKLVLVLFVAMAFSAWGFGSGRLKIVESENMNKAEKQEAVIKPAKPVEEVIYGYINWYGNAPVVYHGFECEDGRIFTLEADSKAKFTVKDITDCQGKRIMLKGYADSSRAGEFQVHKDGVFTVKKFSAKSKK